MSGLFLPILLFVAALVATFLTYRNIRRGGARFYTLEREIILRWAPAGGWPCCGCAWSWRPITW